MGPIDSGEGVVLGGLKFKKSGLVLPFHRLGLKYTSAFITANIVDAIDAPLIGTPETIIGYRVKILRHGLSNVDLEFSGIKNNGDIGSIVAGSGDDSDRQLVDVSIANTPYYGTYNGNQQFHNFDPGLDFVYFGRNALNVLLSQSNEVVFSGCLLNVQDSAFYPIVDNITVPYFSLKVEGDWSNTGSGTPFLSMPAILYGPPCPPIWQDWMPLVLLDKIDE